MESFMAKLPKQLFHGTSSEFLDDMSENGISAPSYWTDSFEKAQEYADSYSDGVVLKVNSGDYDFEVNMQVAQCMFENGDIDVLPSESDLVHSLEFLEGVVCNETIFRFDEVAQTQNQAHRQSPAP
jgi:hypothetical protein